MDFESYLLSDREIPFEDAASFHSILRRSPEPASTLPKLTKEAKLGILKLMFAKRAQQEGEGVSPIQAAAMTDPAVQQALDYQMAVAQAQHSTQQLMQTQQQLEEMQQGMQALQQQAQQTGQELQAAQQQNSQLQEQLQGEMQMRQQANMQAMSAQDQAINTKAMAQKQRMDLSQMADQMSLQLKQVAAQDPEQAQMQQQQAAAQQQEAEQQAALAAMPAKQRKEIEEAQKAQQNADVQGQQAEQAQSQAEQGPMAGAMQQQAAAQQQQQAQAQQPEGGMVAQSAAGMRKVDILRHKLKVAASKCPKTGKAFRGPGLGPGRGRPHGTGVGLGLGPGKGRGRALLNKEKNSEIEKYTKKTAMVPPPSTAYKARMIEAGIGAGLGAMTGAAYEAGRQRFTRPNPTSPSPEEIALEAQNRAAQIKAKESPTLINRMAATKTLAQLDVEKDMRKNPKKAILRRALQGAIVGGAAAPSLMAIKQNLGPKIMGR